MAAPPVDYSPQLRTLMQAAGLGSYRALARAAGVSRGMVDHLRQGQVGRLPVQTLLHLSQALQVPATDLMAQFGAPVDLSPSPVQVSSLPSPDPDGDRRRQFQAEALACLEPWLRQWPTAVAAAQRQPDLPASRLLPLTHPWQELLQRWGVTAIGEVGAELPYDPQVHQPLQGNITPGQRVRVRYLGYRQGDRLLYRAQVSPAS